MISEYLAPFKLTSWPGLIIIVKSLFIKLSDCPQIELIKNNIKSFCGRPLVFWVLASLQESNVDKIIVATDCDEISMLVDNFRFSKVTLYKRDSKNAQATSSTESVMLEYIDSSNMADSDIFMLVQATSPFTQKNHFNEGLDLFKNHDSVLSCTFSKKFIWREEGLPLNYDINNRPRRQDYEGSLIENGAFYNDK